MDSTADYVGDLIHEAKKPGSQVPPGLIGTWKDFRYSLLVEEDDAYQDLEDNNCG